MRRLVGLSLPARSTVKLRLTLLYGGLFLAAGIVLLVLTYALLHQALKPPDRGPHDGGGGPNNGGQNQPPPEERSVEDQVNDARREERKAALNQVIIQGGIALAVTGGGALILGWLVAGRTLRPIQRITAHARRASQANLGDRIGLRGPPDELKELADTIDAMLGRLQAAFESQRHFAAQASHELRTPLAIIRAEADVALAAPDVTERERQFGKAIRAAADRSERLVDRLLALARSESTLRDDTRVDLAELVGDVVGEQARAADTAGVEIDLDLGSATVTGDRALLERLAGNLVENAIRHNRRGGWLRVEVGTEQDAAVLRVANSGPVVPPNAVEHLFEPFQRGRDARRDRAGGFGLGLAIVRSVALAHGGDVTAKAPEAGGLNITVRLPLAPSDAPPTDRDSSRAATQRETRPSGPQPLPRTAPSLSE